MFPMMKRQTTTVANGSFWLLLMLTLMTFYTANARYIGGPDAYKQMTSNAMPALMLLTDGKRIVRGKDETELQLPCRSGCCVDPVGEHCCCIGDRKIPE